MTSNREENIKKSQELLPPEIQHLIITCLPNIPYGSNWGFTDVDKAKSHIDGLKKLRGQGVICRQVSTKKGVHKIIEEVNWDYLMSIVHKIDSSLVTNEDKATYDLFKARGQVELVKFLTGKPMEKTGESMIGIYCINKTTKIVIDGSELPAFCINAETTKAILNNLGYRVFIKQQGYVPALSLTGTLDLAFSNSMLLSPTETGVFIKIKRFTSDIKVEPMVYKKQLVANFNNLEDRYEQTYNKLPY